MLGVAGGRRAATVRHFRSCLRPLQRTTLRQLGAGHRLPNTEFDNLTLMIFGSSTDVGKTIVSAGISAAALRDVKKVCYIKPIQTGDMDEYFVQFYTNPHGNSDIYFRTLNHWKTATSPHIAATLEGTEGGGKGNRVRSDEELLDDLAREIRAFEQVRQHTRTHTHTHPSPLHTYTHTHNRAPQQSQGQGQGRRARARVVTGTRV
jgi:hypothetical protein